MKNLVTQDNLKLNSKVKMTDSFKELYDEFDLKGFENSIGTIVKLYKSVNNAVVVQWPDALQKLIESSKRDNVARIGWANKYDLKYVDDTLNDELNEIFN